MPEFLKRLRGDLLARRNLDIYVVSTLALILAVLSLFPDLVSQQAQNAIILAALALLVINLSVERSNGGSLDSFLNDRSDLKKIAFSERIRGARRLLIYAPSAANLLSGDNLEAIRTGILNNPRGELRVIIQNPNAADGLRILTHQIDESIDYKMQDLPVEIANTLSKFQNIRGWKSAGTFDFRFLDYGPGFSLVVIDPDRTTGQIIFETHGFHNESTERRMNIEITPARSDRWFTYWSEQFDYMWREAKTAEQAGVVL